MSARGRPGALVPQREARRRSPISARGRSGALMPQREARTRSPIRARSRALTPQRAAHGGIR